MAPDHPDMQQFQQSLQLNYQCDIQDVDFLSQHFSCCELAEKQHLLEAGDPAHQVYFIISGILRVYYIDPNGNEVNQQFYQAGEMVAPVLPLTTEEPCPFYLQALNSCRLLTADYQQLQQAGKNYLPWLVAENAILKSVYLKTARREAQMLLGGAEQRYRWFLKEDPLLAQQLPLYQIASYLGVTPVSLSRLRKKLGQNN